MTSQNRLNYVDYDWDNLVLQLQNRLKLKDAWKDVYRSSTGEMLIEFYAYIANLTLYYIERRAEECYLDTAQLRSSVVNLVKLINYVPKRQTSSSGLVTFTLGSAIANDIDIPIGTQVRTADNLHFFIGEKELDVNGDYTGNIVGGGTIQSGSTSLELYALQGKLVQKNIVSTGAVNQEYLLKDSNIENDTVSVQINGEIWTKVSSFVSSESDSKEYILSEDLDGTIRIRFGEGVRGMSPSLNSIILIQYVITDGIDGNVFSGDKITTIVSTITDVAGNVIEDITVTNSSSLDGDGNVVGTFSGGDDAESIDEIKYEAPRVFATGDRLVTRYDFIAVIENIAGVACVNVWGENEENPPNYNMFNRVRIVLLMQNWQHPSTAKKTEITNYIQPKSMLTVKYEYVEAVILEIIPVLDVLVVNNYSLSQVRTDIEELMEGQFELGNTTRLGEHVNYSNLVRLVDALNGVDFHHLTLEIYKLLEASYDSIYQFGETLEAVTIKAGSVRVFVYVDENTYYQIGRDDEAGGFFSVDFEGDPYEDLDGNPTGITVTGSVNYTTGVIGVDLDVWPISSISVYVRYQQDPTETDMAEPIKDKGIVVTQRQVCKLREVDIDTIAHNS